MARERYRIGDLLVDVGAARVERDGRPVRVAGLSFDLLVALARDAPDVVDHDRLAEAVWKLTAVSDETITQRVALLRRALDDDAADPRYVRSVRGRGYALVPAVTTDRPQPRPSRRWWPAGVAALLLFLVFAYLGRSRPGASPAPPAEVRTTPLTADELASRGDEFLSRHRETDNETAIELYDRSLRLEPDHSHALIGLSLALSQRVSKFNHPSTEAERALVLAETRLTAAADDARATYARAFALDSLGRVTPALHAYLRAAELDPSHLAAKADASYLQMVRGDLADALEASLAVLATGERLHYLEVEIGWSLWLLGFDGAAEVWLQRALDLWPDSPFAGSTFARLRLQQGRLQQAEALAVDALEHGVERSELPTILGHLALLRGDRDEAARRYREAAEIGHGIDSGLVRLLLLEDGPTAAARRREALGEIEAGLAAGDEWPGSATAATLLHAGLGDHDAALAALDRAIDLGYRESAWLMLDPMLAGLRARPGFVERIERIALAIEEEQRAVLAAEWLPDDLLEPELPAAPR